MPRLWIVLVLRAAGGSSPPGTSYPYAWPVGWANFINGAVDQGARHGPVRLRRFLYEETPVASRSAP